MIHCLFYKEIVNIERKLKLINYKELDEVKEDLKNKIDLIIENELERRNLKWN